MKINRKIELTKKEQKIYDKTQKYLEKINEKNIEQKMKIVESALKIKDIEKRYSYLYDLICDYLDQEFKEKNICDFCDGICKRRRDMIDRNIKKDTYENGCCYSYYKKESCKHLIPGKECQIKNIGCKIFTCYYLKKNGYRYKLNNIYLSRYFFNSRQKFYMESTFFVDKDEIMKEIIKRS